MITALHALLYSEDPPATRAFFRDVLGWPYLEDTSSEPGWLIFRSRRNHERAVSKGRRVTSEPVDRGFGLCTTLRVPEAGEILLFHPSYSPSYSL